MKAACQGFSPSMTGPTPGTAAEQARTRLRSSSRPNRSLMLRLVTNLPSRPANGLVFTRNVMRTVGSSTCACHSMLITNCGMLQIACSQAIMHRHTPMYW